MNATDRTNTTTKVADLMTHDNFDQVDAMLEANWDHKRLSPINHELDSAILDGLRQVCGNITGAHFIAKLAYEAECFYLYSAFDEVIEGFQPYDGSDDEEQDIQGSPSNYREVPSWVTDSIQRAEIRMGA